MTHPSDIYYLRHVKLDSKLALQLSPFISAWRPHDSIPTREELGDRLPLEPPVSMKNLCEDVNIDYTNWKAKNKCQQ